MSDEVNEDINPILTGGNPRPADGIIEHKGEYSKAETEKRELARRNGLSILPGGVSEQRSGFSKLKIHRVDKHPNHPSRQGGSNSAA
jgi:hypothetical protein